MDIATLIPSFGGLIWTVAAFVVALSVIVAVHEYGHYIVGRWSGIKAEVFSIGFGPVLFSRMDKHGTRWQIAALPFGGFVKFLGDAGAASDKASDEFDKMDDETKRHTMHGAPLWARAATVLAGPVFNFVLSILIFAGVSLFSGTAKEPLEVGTLNPLPAGVQTLMAGDTILTVGGTEVTDYASFYEAVKDLPIADGIPYEIIRDGQEQTLQAPYPFPPLVASIQPSSAAMDVGFEVGDVIVAIDDTPVMAFSQVQDAVTASEGRALVMRVWRDGTEMDFAVAPRRVDLPNSDGGFDSRWLIGMTGGLAFEPATATPGVFEAISYGANQTVFIIKSSLSGLWHMVTGAISSCNLSGPLGIAETSGAMASQGAQSFIWFIAVLSTAVGLLNLFPIPVLDGGHLVFHAWEAATGRPPSDRALQLLMGFGLFLMLGLMVFALGNDLFCP